MIGRLLITALIQMFEKTFQPFHDVFVSVIEIACVPWVCDVPILACEFQQPVNFSIRVAADDAVQSSNIFLVHDDEIVEIIVILPRHLACAPLFKGYANLPQLGFCASMNVVSDFFSAGGGGFDVKFLAAAGF